MVIAAASQKPPISNKCEACHGGGSNQVWQWVYNLPSGMMGTHTFTGHLLGLRAELVSDGNYSGSCGSNPMATVEADISPQTVTVTFVP